MVAVLLEYLAYLPYYSS